MKTTGLYPWRDKIIEIGAVRFRDEFVGTDDIVGHNIDFEDRPELGQFF